MSDLVVCLANRRWRCWYERSQHLMTQCARERTTVFVEEPELDSSGPDVELSDTRTGVITMIPHAGGAYARGDRVAVTVETGREPANGQRGLAAGEMTRWLLQ